jgi:energy-coupling factor transport system permease protein
MTWNVRQRFGRYMALESPLHRLDPVAKLLVFCLLVASVLVCDSWPAIGAVASYVVVLCVISSVRMRFYLDSLKGFAWMFALSFAVNLFFPHGQEVRRLSYQALNVAGIFSVRLVLMIVAATLLTLVTSPSEIGDSLLLLTRLKGRVGRRASEFAIMVSVALRFVPVMFEEAERIRAAQMLRGQPTSGPVNKVRSLVALIVPLLDSALRRSVNLGYALEARCYGYRLPRTPGLRVGPHEIIFGGSGIGMLVILIRMR